MLYFSELMSVEHKQFLPKGVFKPSKRNQAVPEAGVQLSVSCVRTCLHMPDCAYKCVHTRVAALFTHAYGDERTNSGV